MDDAELLAEYAASGSEDAFGELVRRYVSLVHSTALRIVGNAHLAEEVTQAVFIILAKKAGHMRKGTILSGWFYRTTRFAATRALRSELRRARWESAAAQTAAPAEQTEPVWTQLAPMLDEALAQLNDQDRVAIVLRFFENKSLREVGSILGGTEGAAKKRVVRALEKMKTFFGKRGVLLTSAAIGGTLSGNALQAAPAGLATTICSVAAGKGTTADASTLALVKGTMKAMFWSKTKLAIPFVVGLALLLSVPRMWSQQPGSLDLTFHPQLNIGQSGFVNGMVPQTDGKLIVFGSFQANFIQDRQPYYYYGLIRLFEDGRADTNFPHFGEGVISDVAMQPDGKLVLAGSWPNTIARKHGNISRLNSDGTIDRSFDPGEGFEQHYLGFTNVVVIRRVLIDSNGKILVAGDFVKAAGVSNPGLARLNADGSLDTTFVPAPFQNERYSLGPVLQPDGKILTWSFSTVPSTAGKGLVRLNRDGSLDSGFNPPTGTGPLAVLNDGRILCWQRASPASIDPINLIRLNADGTRDTAFQVVLSGELAPLVESVIVQDNGKILISGSFTRVNGAVRNYIVRLNSNGAVDSTFDAGTGLRKFSSPLKSRIVRDRFGKLLISGRFTHVNDVPREQMARLYLEPVLALQSASLSPDRTFHAELATPASRMTRVETSTDLRAWIPLATFTNGNRSLSFFDRATDFPHRFYRAVLVDNP